MWDVLQILKWEDCYLALNPALEIGINNSVKIRVSAINQKFAEVPVQQNDFTEEINQAIVHVLSDDELVVLYWAKKCRSLQYIQTQVQGDRSAMAQMIEKLHHLSILQISVVGPEELRSRHYTICHQRLEAPENLHLRYQWNSAVSKFADQTYILDKNDDTRYTYHEFDEIVKYIMSTLIQNGLNKGDKIVLHADINFEAIALFWACMQLGIVFIPVNALLPEVVIEGLIDKYNPKAIFLSHEAGFRKKWNDKAVFFDSNEITESIPPDKMFFSEWLKNKREIESIPNLNENDLAVILQTSGSTGVPKGVKLAHGQLFQSAINLVETFSWNERNRYVCINDLDSITGFRSACVTTVQAGGTCIIPSFSVKSKPTDLLDCIYETRATCLSTGPSLLNHFLSKKDVTTQLESVKYIISAGSALTTQLKTEFFRKTNKKISNVYGLTETAGIVIGEPTDRINFTGNYIGYPVDCMVKIVDEDNNNVKAGEIGELLLYGYTVFKGYYSDSEPTPIKIQQWFVTGDLVRMGPDGSIELTGRKKDFMKNARGEIIYFSEIEDALAPLPFIKDLGMIAFFKDESERGALFVILNDSAPMPKNIVEEIKQTLITTVGRNKIPSAIKIIDKIPRNKYGKLLKTELQQY